jgi:ketosteroid isomerase-like protein
VTEENVEIVRRHHDAFNRRDLDGIVQTYDPDAEVDFSRSPGIEAGIYRGRRAAQDFWNTFFETWKRAIVSADEHIDCGETVIYFANPNALLGPGRNRGRGVWRVCRDTSRRAYR